MHPVLTDKSRPRPHPRLEEQPQLLAALVLEVVGVVQRLVHAQHAEREGLACQGGDVGGGHCAHHPPALGVTVVGSQVPAINKWDRGMTQLA